MGIIANKHVCWACGFTTDKNVFQWDAYCQLQWPSGGVCLGGCLPRGCLPRVGVCLGGACLWDVFTPRTEFLTHTCENITFPQLLLRANEINSNLHAADFNVTPVTKYNRTITIITISTNVYVPLRKLTTNMFDFQNQENHSRSMVTVSGHLFPRCNK